MEDFFIETVLYDQIDIIGLKTGLTQLQEFNYRIISEHWKRFNNDLHRITGHASSSSDWVKYGITYKQNEKFNYLACVPYDINCSYPSNMIRKSIPAGYYALFRHTGKMTDLTQTMSYIFKEAIPSENLNMVIRENIGIIFIEKYDRRFNWNKPDSIIDLLVPVIK